MSPLAPPPGSGVTAEAGARRLWLTAALNPVDPVTGQRLSRKRRWVRRATRPYSVELPRSRRADSRREVSSLDPRGMSRTAYGFVTRTASPAAACSSHAQPNRHQQTYSPSIREGARCAPCSVLGCHGLETLGAGTRPSHNWTSETHHGAGASQARIPNFRSAADPRTPGPGSHRPSEEPRFCRLFFLEPDTP